MDQRWLRRQLAERRSIQAIASEAGRDPSTVAYWIHKHGLYAPHGPKHASRGGIDHTELRALVKRGPFGSRDRGDMWIQPIVRSLLAASPRSPNPALPIHATRRAETLRDCPRVPVPWVDSISSRGTHRRVSLRQVRHRPGRTTPARRQGDLARRGRRHVPPVWLRPVRRCASSSTIWIRRRRYSTSQREECRAPSLSSGRKRESACYSARTATPRLRPGLRQCRLRSRGTIRGSSMVERSAVNR